MTGTRWRVAVDLRSSEVGAAAAFDAVVDWDDVPPLPIPGLVDILSRWVWQDGPDTRLWVGAVVEAPAAAAAAQRLATAVAHRTRGLRTRGASVHATESAQDDEADEALDTAALPGADAPFVVPVRATRYERSGRRLTVHWASALDPVADVTVEVTESLVVGVFERRSPLLGPNAETGELLIAGDRHAVVDVGDAPAGLPVLDRYSGEYLAER